MLKGFTVFLPHRQSDLFVVTDRSKKTRKFARFIITEMSEHFRYQNEEQLQEWENYIYSHLQPAACERKTLSNGREYYDIHGENFGGRGSFLDEGKTFFLYE